MVDKRCLLMQLPADMNAVIGRSNTRLLWSSNPDSQLDNHTVQQECYEAHVLMYESNPFVYSQQASQVRVQSAS